MDLTDTIQANSDQLDAIDLIAGPRTFTITEISKGNAEQPVNLHLAEFPRVWRPGKSMRRVLVACWGKDASAYVGRRVTLYCDPTVKFGGEAVGGTRISHLSHLDRPKTMPLPVTRGKSVTFKVQPLVEERAPEVPLTDRISQAIGAFANGGITQAQLETRVGKESASWTDRDVADLDALFGALRRKEISKDEAFPSEDKAQAEEPPSA